MKQKSALNTVHFINIPDDFPLSDSTFKIDKTIPLPVQEKDADSPGNFNMKELTVEQILSGILTVLSYDKKNPHLDYYRSIIKKARPNIFDELTQAAVLKTKNEDWDLAEELFMALQGLSPDDPVTLLNMALFFEDRAENYKNANLMDDATAYENDARIYYNKAMETEPPLADAFFNAGFFYAKINDFSEAKSCLEAYLALVCDVEDEKLGENGIEKKEKAQNMINYISNCNMDNEIFKNAYKLISQGEEEKGLNEVRKFLEKNQKVSNAWFLLGWGLRRLSRFEEAKMAFLKAIECGDDKNAQTYNEIAICSLEAGDFDEAKKMLFKALEISPEDIKIISNLGYLSLKMGDKENAQKYFSTVLEYNPNDKIALNELSKLER